MSWQDEWRNRNIPEYEWPIEHENPICRVTRCHRRTAEENSPGLSVFYCRVFNHKREPVGGVEISFETESSDGVAYDHPDVWGVTGKRSGNLGFLYYTHPAKPTRYNIYVEGALVLSNVRLDLGNEYFRPSGMSDYMGWRPVNRPGVYSYDFEFELKDAE